MSTQTTVPPAAGQPAVNRQRPSVAQELYSAGSGFDFFQAVSLLEQAAALRPDKSSLASPAARFATPVSTAFPASAIEEIAAGEEHGGPARVTVNFMGLTGPSGVLPRHYTELLIQLEGRLRDAAKRTLNAWYDLFNNRLIGQLYRVWAKCRIDRGLAEGSAERTDADPFSTCLYSLIGLGQPTLRNRRRVQSSVSGQAGATVVDRAPDLALARHAGTLARRQRSARQIGAFLSDYFCVPISVEQFQGQWLELQPGDRTRIGLSGSSHLLGVDAVLGSRVWDRQSRVRVRVGPLDAERFSRFLPDSTRGPQRRRFIMLCQMVRMAIGPELDFDVQLVLKQDDVPRTQVVRGEPSARLGWNTWLSAAPLERDGGEPVFEPIETDTL